LSFFLEVPEPFIHSSLAHSLIVVGITAAVAAAADVDDVYL